MAKVLPSRATATLEEVLPDSAMTFCRLGNSCRNSPFRGAGSTVELGLEELAKPAPARILPSSMKVTHWQRPATSGSTNVRSNLPG